MKIVFVEVQTWEKEILEKSFPKAIFIDEKLTQENVVRYKDTEILSCFIYSEITKDLLDKLPNLKYITTRSTGFDNLDIDACRKRNISISNVPEYGSSTVAEFTFGLLLDLTRQITKSILQAKQLNFDHQTIRGVDLFGKTIGIVGLGKIGRHVLQIAQGYGMNVLAYNRSQDENFAKTRHFTYMDLNSLLKNSDVVTFHLPLTKETHHIINQNNILMFKKGSFLINAGRGGLIDTQAVVLGLEKGILAGVGLDVLEGENELPEEVAMLNIQSQNAAQLKTLLYNHILLNHPKVLITPHNAFNSIEALTRILDVSVENINSFLHGAVQNPVYNSL